MTMYRIQDAGKAPRLVKPKFKKRNVYVPLGSPILDIVVERAGSRGYKAPTIVRDISLYYGVLKNKLAELWDIFEADEMSAILQVFQSQDVNYTSLWVWMEGGFAMLVKDEFAQTTVCEDFEIGMEEVLSKIDNLTELQLLCLIDFTIIWWDTFDKTQRAKEMLQPFTGGK